jgi:hypothetical protein
MMLPHTFASYAINRSDHGYSCAQAVRGVWEFLVGETLQARDLFQDRELCRYPLEHFHPDRKSRCKCVIPA